jgi:hypothetical protein
VPHATIIMQIEAQGGGLRVKRELEAGWFQWVELPMPAVLTIQSGINKVRYATLKGIMAAKKKEIATIARESLGVTHEADAAHRAHLRADQNQEDRIYDRHAKRSRRKAARKIEARSASNLATRKERIILSFRAKRGTSLRFRPRKEREIPRFARNDKGGAPFPRPARRGATTMNILLITEQREAQWNKTSFETLAAAQQIAAETKSRLCRPWSSAKVSRRWPASLPPTKLDEVLLVEHDLLAAYTPDGYTIALQQAIAQPSPICSSCRTPTRCAISRRSWPRRSAKA